MPRATISTEAIRKDLKSLPGGFVALRRMPYGKWLHRQEMAMKMTVAAQGRGQSANFGGEVVMANKAVTVFEFTECIVDHNLTNDADEPFDFRSPHALEMLDPKIGNEIGQYIMELHEFDLGNSLSDSGSSSPEVATVPSET